MTYTTFKIIFCLIILILIASLVITAMIFDNEVKTLFSGDEKLMSESNNICQHFGFNEATYYVDILYTHKIVCDKKFYIFNVQINKVLKCFQFNENGACISGDYFYEYVNNTGYVKVNKE